MKYLLLLALLSGASSAVTSTATSPSICHVVATWRPLAWSERISGDPTQAFRAVTLRATTCPPPAQARIIFSTETGRRPVVDSIFLGAGAPLNVVLSGVPWWWEPEFLSASGKAAYPIPYTREP